jgi:hypothetical protein
VGFPHAGTVHGFGGSGFSGSLTLLDLEFPITYILQKASK